MPSLLPLTGIGAGAAKLWSLSYDGSDDETDCGLPASLILPAAGFTVDLYWKHPATLPDLANFTLISQGSRQSTGWGIWIVTDASNHFRAWAWFNTPFGVLWLARPDGYTDRTPNVWHYFRLRWTSTGARVAAFSMDAGEEHTSNTYGFGYTPDESNHFCLGRDGNARHFHILGILIYVHAWNNTQGALGAVPTTPFAIGANTAGRWLHQDGSGATLADTSGNGNDGTISGATWVQDAPAGWTVP